MPTPKTPGNCVIYGTVLDLRQKPEKFATVQAFREDSSILSSGSGVSHRPIKTSTNGQGYFELELIQGQLVLIEIPCMDMRKKFTVPAQDDIDFFTITTQSPP